MQVLMVFLWIFGVFFIYCIGMGVTKAIGLKAWGEPSTSFYSSRFWCEGRTNPPMVKLAQIFWPITLVIWSFIGLWWIGVNSPELTVRFFKWFDKATADAARQAQIRAAEQAKKELPPKPKKRRWRKDKIPRSGVELDIYKDKDK